MQISKYIQEIGQPIAYYPKLTNITGGVKETIFICQLLYWEGKQSDKNGWIYKTQKEMEKETGLSRYEQETARKNLGMSEKGKKFIDEKRDGIHRKLYYKINHKNFNNTWESFINEGGNSMGKNHIEQCGNPPQNNGENQQTYTENTTENTTNKLSKDNSYAQNEHREEKPIENNDEFSEKTNEIIAYWNTLSHAQQHKNSNTKTYKTSARFIENLLNGSPLSSTKNGYPTKPFDNFCRSQNIPENQIYRKWQPDEVKNILKIITEEKLKSNERRSLSSVLWNNFANGKAFSYFMFVANEMEVPVKYKALVKKYADIVLPDIDTVTLTMWSKQFQDFIESGKRNIDEIRSLLKWYSENYNDQFTPKFRRVQRSYKAEEFLKGIESVEDARKRKQNPQTSSSTKDSNTRFRDGVKRDYNF